MSELLREESLSTADNVNPSRSTRGEEFGTDTINALRNSQRAVAGGMELRQNPLFPENELDGFRSRWSEVQISFVDQPREAVEQADHLVASVVKRIAEQFASEREQMENIGTGVKTSIRKTCARPSNAIAHFSIDCFRSRAC